MNNNLHPCLDRMCKCGKYISIGESKAGIGLFNYVCPDCTHILYSKPLTSEEYYKSMGVTNQLLTFKPYSQ